MPILALLLTSSGAGHSHLHAKDVHAPKKIQIKRTDIYSALNDVSASGLYVELASITLPGSK